MDPASACACVPLTEDNNLGTVLARSDALIVEGRLAESLPGDPSWSKRFDVDTVYAGDSPSQLVLALYEPTVTDAVSTAGYVGVTAPDCTFVVRGSPGASYVLFLRPDPSGAQEPIGCDSFATADESRVPYFAELHAALRSLTQPHAPDSGVVTPTIATTLQPRAAKPTPSSPQQPAPSAVHTGDNDLPVAIILPLAFILPLAVLAVGALIKPKGGGH